MFPQRELWIGVNASGAAIGHMVLDDDFVDQLYVDPRHTGNGVGSELPAVAQSQRPAGLQLWTFQSNEGGQEVLRETRLHPSRVDRWRFQRGRSPGCQIHVEAKLALRTMVPPNNSPHLDSAISRYAGSESMLLGPFVLGSGLACRGRLAVGAEGGRMGL